MKYAVRKDGQGWRVVNGPDDIGADEYFSETQPSIIPKWSADLILSRVRDAREVVLNRIAGIALAAMVEGDQDTVNGCLSARSALLGITSMPTVKAATDDESLSAALEAAYMAIVAATPGNVRSAFRDFRV